MGMFPRSEDNDKRNKGNGLGNRSFNQDRLYGCSASKGSFSPGNTNFPGVIGMLGKSRKF